MAPLAAVLCAPNRGLSRELTLRETRQGDGFSVESEYLLNATQL